jgi:hypothetical protein
MARAFEQSHVAYERKDGAAAKELSNEGKAHQRKMERLNAEASAWIFRGEFANSSCASLTTLFFSFFWVCACGTRTVGSSLFAYYFSQKIIW